MTTDTVGGVWTFTQELAAGLLEQNQEVAFVSLGGPRTPDQRAWCTRTQAAWGTSFVDHHSEAPLEWMQDNGAAALRCVPLLLEVAAGFQPDVLHSNQFCFGALRLAKTAVITAHSDVLSWASSCGDGPLEETAWLHRYKALVEMGLDGADAVVAPTRVMLQALRQNYSLPHRQLVIPNGRKIGAFAHGPRRLQAVTAGRLWDRAKGTAILSRLITSVPLLIAGDTGEEETRTTSSRTAVSFLGPLSQEALLRLFTESAIYLCTSLYEPFGLAPLEAALCGCAVIANDIPSLREVWEDGACYFSGAESLSRILEVIGHDQEALRSLQSRSLKRAQRYTRDRMSLSYLRLYETLLAPESFQSYVA